MLVSRRKSSGEELFTYTEKDNFDINNSDKGIVHPKILFLSFCHEILTLMLFQTSKTSSEHKLRIFWWNPRAFWPDIDSNATDNIKAQKGN